MKTVAVLGGGPAGAVAAERLASAGLDTILIDEKLAWEKPCGGGVTYKAYSQYPFLIDNNTPKKVVTQSFLSAPKAGRASLELEKPILVYSRYDLNLMLLKRAEKAGAKIEKTRVTNVERKGTGWTLSTLNGNIAADYCIVATGARNPLRSVGTVWTADDTMYALGYYVPDDRQHIDVHFLGGIEGYIWVFPRQRHLSVGICGKGESAQALRVRLERYMQEQGISRKNAQFYAHMLPALHARSWKDNRVAGDGWLAVGDAAGLVDPVTGEGIYYAVRSADLAAQTVLNDSLSPDAKAAAYRTVLDTDFTRDLHIAALLAHRIFTGRFLFGAIPTRVVAFIRRSPRFRELMQDIFAGTQSYDGLSHRLFSNLGASLGEATLSFFLKHEPL